MEVMGRAKWGKGWSDVDPQRTLFLLLGDLTSVPIFSIKKCDRESAHIDGYTDTLTDANRFHNRSHNI